MNRLYVVVALVLVLGGCGGDPPSAAPPSPSLSPSTTPTVSAAPVMPEEAKEDSKKGAVAFVKYYVRVLNWTSGSGNTGPVRSLQTKTCGACEAIADLVDRTYSLGGRIEGDGWRILKLTYFQDPDLPNEVLINTATSVAAQRVYQSTDEEVMVYAGNPRRELLWGLTYSLNRWRVSTLQVLPE